MKSNEENYMFSEDPIEKNKQNLNEVLIPMTNERELKIELDTFSFEMTHLFITFRTMERIQNNFLWYKIPKIYSKKPFNLNMVRSSKSLNLGPLKDYLKSFKMTTLISSSRRFYVAKHEFFKTLSLSLIIPRISY